MLILAPLATLMWRWTHSSSSCCSAARSTPVRTWLPRWWAKMICKRSLTTDFEDDECCASPKKDANHFLVPWRELAPTRAAMFWGGIEVWKKGTFGTHFEHGMWRNFIDWTNECSTECRWSIFYSIKLRLLAILLKIQSRYIGNELVR